LGGNVGSAWRLLAFPVVGQIILLSILLGIAWFIKQNPLQNVESFINAVLTSSSVLFGFLTLSISRHLEELRKQEREISDLATELLRLLDKVRNDKKLANKVVHFSTKYWVWGFKGFSHSDMAESTILVAYDYLLKNFRSVVHGCRSLVFAWGIPGLTLLLSSIILAVFSKIMLLDPVLVGVVGLSSIIFGIAVSILGWCDSNARLEKNSESLFNIRHTIWGDLFRETSLVGYMEDA
jgi:hypothetical protein